MTTDFPFSARLARLRETKLRHTRDKMARGGYMDHDDHGRVPLPPGFEWKPVPSHPNGGFYGVRAWGQNFRSLMDVHPVYVDPDDALAGRWMLHLWGLVPGFNPDYKCSELVPEQQLYGLVTGIGAPHHFGPDLPMGMALGWGGLLEKVRTCRGQHGPEKKDFYDALENIVRGVQTLIRRTAAHARQLAAAQGDPAVRRNLEEIAAINEWLADGPPRTFREVCQWLAWWAVVSRTYNGDGAGGQLDELLRPFYERETAAGTLTDDEAIFDIACLLINDTKYYQLGGPAADGHDLVSRVSYLVVEAAHRVSIACNLTVRVHDAMDRDFFLTTVRHLFEDRQGWPRYAGDRALVAGFMKNGFPAEMARRRIAVGCHWMSLEGREYTLNDCVKVNVAKVFDVALEEMFAGAPGTPGMATLWGLFEKHLRRAVLCIAKGMDFQLAHQEDNTPELMLDLFCHGPVEKGLDASHGGVEFYNLCVDGSGLATVADSFAALDQRIERDSALTWPQIAASLRDNYAGAGGEQTRQMMKSAPRYGQGDSLGDQWALRVSQLFTQIVKEHPTPGGRNMIPGWFSWSNTIPMGRQLRATPNGRRAGEPISHGANPDPGFRRDGAPTAMVLAIAAVQPGYGNTAPVQMEIDPGVCKGEGGIERIASLITTHFDRGGTLFNINVIDRARLLAAHRNPAAFPDLVVRVTGFSAFFSTLSPEFRQLVVDRILAEE